MDFKWTVDSVSACACAAILACAVATAEPPRAPSVAAPPAATPAPPAAQPLPMVALAKPVEVRARTRSGGTFAGKLERWDGTAMHGSFGSRRWDELTTRDAHRVFLQVMDKTSAAQWLALAELLAGLGDGATLATEAYSKTKSLGTTDVAIADSRARAAVVAAARKAQEAAERDRRLQGGKTGAAPAPGPPPPPWPELTPTETDLARSQVTTSARAALDVTGVRGDIVESKYFILAGNLTPEQQRAAMNDLDGCCARAMQVLGMPSTMAPFWGKALVLAYATEEEFTLAEASVFNSKVQKGQRAALHTDGPKVTISCWRGNEERAFTTALMQKMVLGLLYRDISPAPLPEWAAEGFALWAARIPEPNAHVDQQWRAQGLRFLRQGGNAADIMTWTAAAGTWPGKDAIGESVGFLLMDLMLGEAPAKFGPWVKAIKQGKTWVEALKEVYGTDPVSLAASASAWYRTNDGAPRR